MSDTNPVLLLLVLLLEVAGVAVWALGIYVAYRFARRGGRRPWVWVLLAIFAGPVFLGAAALAKAGNRPVGVWIAVQVLALLAAGGAYRLLAGYLGSGALADAGILLAVVALALSPLIVLGLLAPARAAKASPAQPGQTLVEAIDLHRTYMLGKRELQVLRGVSLSVKRGEFLAILGASGSGKSTLLHLMGLLDVMDKGSLVLDGADSRGLTSSQRDQIRSKDIGFVFQFYHLLPELSVLENVMLPAMTANSPLGWLANRRPARQRALEIISRVGLSERVKHRPKQLSGGEQQRVAIARALMNSPKLLLADEPTGNLDSKTGGQIVKLLKQLNQETRQTVVMVTHDAALAALADRIVHLRDGRLQ